MMRPAPIVAADIAARMMARAAAAAPAADATDIIAIGADGRIARIARAIDDDAACAMTGTDGIAWAIADAGWAGCIAADGRAMAAIPAGARIPAAARAYLRDMAA